MTVGNPHRFAPCRTAVRAVREAVAALEAAGGFELVSLELTPELDGWEAARLYYGIFTAEGQMWSYTQGLEGERLSDAYMHLWAMSNMPDILRPLFSGVCWLLGAFALRGWIRVMNIDSVRLIESRYHLQHRHQTKNTKIGERRLQCVAGVFRRLGISTREYWQLCADLEGYKQGWLRLLEQKQLDGFISPATALPAFPHGAARQLSPAW